jgi:dihydrodipicolinate synthase/N-acetylneuraminate lyase
VRRRLILDGVISANFLPFDPSLKVDEKNLRPEMACGHIASVAEATSLPIVVFVYPATATGQQPE